MWVNTRYTVSTEGVHLGFCLFCFQGAVYLSTDGNILKVPVQRCARFADSRCVQLDARARSPYVHLDVVALLIFILFGRKIQTHKRFKRMPFILPYLVFTLPSLRWPYLVLFAGRALRHATLAPITSFFFFFFFSFCFFFFFLSFFYLTDKFHRTWFSLFRRVVDLFWCCLQGVHYVTPL